MINIRQAMAMITGSALLYGASAAQAGGATGTITFSPVVAAASEAPEQAACILHTEILLPGMCPSSHRVV